MLPLWTTYAHAGRNLFQKTLFIECTAVRYLHHGRICTSASLPQRHSLYLSHIHSKKLLQLNPSCKQFARYTQSTPFNTIIMFVPEQEAWVVERMGKFNRILQPGLNFLIPVVDRVKYVHSLKEYAIDIPTQPAITLDNVILNVNGVLYLRVVDPYKASYGAEDPDPEFAITQLAQKTIRSELGKMSSDSISRERESLNFAIIEAIDKASNAWGIDCLRCEIRDISLHHPVNEAMQVKVERNERAATLESKGDISLHHLVNEAMQVKAERNERAATLESKGDISLHHPVNEVMQVKAERNERAATLESKGEIILHHPVNEAMQVIAGRNERAATSLSDKAFRILFRDVDPETQAYMKRVLKYLRENKMDRSKYLDLKPIMKGSENSRALKYRRRPVPIVNRRHLEKIKRRIDIKNRELFHLNTKDPSLNHLKKEI